ncbi:MAG: ABC transporter ATP-binding protein [candidate division Zixibacteria bacterium]|nr:ABC transporter ATP-binding protein [candidate division Zixibacteria bacterium]
MHFLEAQNNASPDIEFVIEVEGLSKRYGDILAVDNIEFNIKKGEVFGFLGPNGSGKTTTIRMLCGILQPTSGTGRTVGFDISTQSERIKEHIGYMSQKFSLYDDLTVIENLRFYAGLHSIPKSVRENRIAQVLERAGLQDRRLQRAGSLSGGWKQRVALVCSMVHQPKVVFLDEPTAGVDPVSRRRFWEMIYRSAEEGSTFLVTTHYMDEAERFDRLVFIDKGKLIAQGTPEFIKRTEFRHKLWEIKCQPLSTAEEVLRHSPDVIETSLQGVTIHVATSLQFSDVDSLVGALTRGGVKVESIHETVPSLEDVFISLAAGNNEHTGELT